MPPHPARRLAAFLLGPAPAPADWLHLGRRGGGVEEPASSHRVTSVCCLPPPRCSQSAAAGGLKELGAERRGGRGWAEAGGNPITETPAWTFPPPTLSGRVGEGSPPPPATRGAEPGAGEATLSAGAAVARALTCGRLRCGTRRGARGVPQPVFLRGIVTLRGGGAGRVLLRRRPPCPDARLSPAGWGGGSGTPGSRADGAVSRDGAGKASRPSAWRGEDRPYPATGWGRVAPMRPASVSLSDEVCVARARPRRPGSQAAVPRRGGAVLWNARLVVRGRVVVALVAGRGAWGAEVRRGALWGPGGLVPKPGVPRAGGRGACCAVGSAFRRSRGTWKLVSL